MLGITRIADVGARVEHSGTFTFLVAAMANVLVVDDIRDVADSFAELLTLFGHDVRVAYSAGDAEAAIESRAPEVVLLDINMPVVDGVELAKQIRQRWGAGIRLVALTAYPRGSFAAKLVEAGFDAFVSKSTQPLELAFAIRGRQGASGFRTGCVDRRRSHRCASVARRTSDSKANSSPDDRL